jgi:uncharacterized protein YndB with AHSA1/START domain
MLKWVLIALATLAGLGAAVALVGAGLPRDHVATRSAAFAAPPEAVFAAIVEEVARQTEVPVEIVERQPPSRLVTRIADPELPFGGTWTFTLAAEGGGTRLTITEHGQIHNVIFRAVARFGLGYTASIDAFLAALAPRLAGGATTPPS